MLAIQPPRPLLSPTTLLLLSLVCLLQSSFTSSGSIPPIANIPESVVISTPTVQTERELETNHDVAEIPIIPPDLFPVSGVDDVSFPSEPFRPSGDDDKLKRGTHVPDPKPCGRWQHTTVPIGAELYVYGGVANGGAGSLNDVWMYNGAGGGWTKLEKNELCTLPVRVNPRLPSSNNGARPPFFPAPPPTRLAPGLSSERLLRLKHDQERVTVKKARTMPIDRMSPVPTMEPAMPSQEKYTSGDQDSSALGGLPSSPFRRRLRRRRLQSYQELGVLPTAEHNGLQTNPRTLNDLWVFDMYVLWCCGVVVAATKIMFFFLTNNVAFFFSSIFFSRAKRRWFQPFPTERQPPPRWLHGAVDIDKSLVIFGGVTNNLMLLNDVWRYQPESNNWEVLGEGTDAMDRPTTREGMSMVTSDKGLNVSDCCLVWQYR